MKLLLVHTIIALIGVILVSVAQASPYCRRGRYCPPVMPPGVPPPQVTAQILSMNGTGCPSGSASAAISPDMTTLSILFDNFTTEIPSSLAPNSQIKKCTIHLGFRFYGQYRIAIIGSDIRGFYALPAQSQTKISVMHNSIFLNPKEREKMNFVKSFVGPTDGELDMHSRFPDMALWSHCGTQNGPMPMRFMSIDMTVESQNQNTSEDLIAGINSVDFNGHPGLNYHLIWAYDTKNCPR